ncbi:hypothetical protein J4426_00025 [Candidatus Woesearchaeota archaeon]|nr:hypothetical protein [Candidatus Woesearchaeota archaeon]
MKKYYTLSILMILSLLLVVGCNKDDTKKAGTFFGGIDGVSIEFEKLAPPTQFGQDDSVSIKTILKNKGEFDLQTGKAKARIFGINLNNFGLTSDYKGTEGSLRARGEFSEQGGEQVIDFGNARYNQIIVNSQDFTIRARVCYPYQTKALVDVCITPLIAKEGDKGVCTIDGQKIKESDISSAPVQVTEVTEEIRGSDQVRFNIGIENKGKGNVFLPDTTCEQTEEGATRVAMVDKLEVDVLNPSEVQCDFRTSELSSRGIVELNGGKTVLSCFTTATDSYEEKLNIRLNYVYLDETSVPITIFESTK